MKLLKKIKPSKLKGLKNSGCLKKIVGRYFICSKKGFIYFF